MCLKNVFLLFLYRVKLYQNNIQQWEEPVDELPRETISKCMPGAVALYMGVNVCVNYDYIPNYGTVKLPTTVNPLNFDITVARTEKFDNYLIQYKQTKKSVKILLDTPGSIVSRKIELDIQLQSRRVAINVHFLGSDYKFLSQKDKLSPNSEGLSFVYKDNKEIKGTIEDIYTVNEEGANRLFKVQWYDKVFKIDINSGGPERDCMSQKCRHSFQIYTDFADNPINFEGKIKFYYN